MSNNSSSINGTTTCPGHDCVDKDSLGTRFLPLFPDEHLWNEGLRGIIYFLALIWFFMGVSITSDIFVTAIEYIVSRSKEIPFEVRRGSLDHKTTLKVEVRIWNPTVANLTLMALGSSAPEIMLSVIETVVHKFEAKKGDLGPGTIVGSAAFNLLFITGMCILWVPNGQIRRIEIYNVFIITTLFSMFAYLWMWAVLEIITPNKVTLSEAIITLLCFPTLVALSWWADNNFCLDPKKNLRKSFLEKAAEAQRNLEDMETALVRVPHAPDLMTAEEHPLYSDGNINPIALRKFYDAIRGTADLSNQEAASLVAYKLMQTQQHSRMWYRMGATRALMGSSKLQPELNKKLKEVYNLVGLKRFSEEEIGADKLQKTAVFDFQAASYAIPENIGTLTITVVRNGRSDNEVSLKVASVDGTAKAGKHYQAIDAVLVFEPFVFERSFDVNIVNDYQWEPIRSFYLRLMLMDSTRKDAMLGSTTTMEVSISDDDKPGTLEFSKRGQLESETTRTVEVEVIRTSGWDGKVGVKWRTIPDPKGAVRHPDSMTGKLLLNHGQASRNIKIPLLQGEGNEPSSETFEVELFEPEGGASLGKIVKTSVTVSDEAEYQDTVGRAVEMAAEEMNIIGGGHTTIRKQLRDAFQVGGGEEPATIDYVMHFVCFFWKVLFALIPPPNYYGGWLCFCVSLSSIGVLTFIIGEIATIFGCICGLKPTVTAITFVALGTSLPDTFASMTAARSDSTADNAIGNVTGSNSVNVFLGLGLPWTLATIYHRFGSNKDYEVISGGGLGFSVLVFFGVATCGLVLMTARRYLAIFGKAELGGPKWPKIISAGFFFGLWLLYITLSALRSYHVIKGDPVDPDNCS